MSRRTIATSEASKRSRWRTFNRRSSASSGRSNARPMMWKAAVPARRKDGKEPRRRQPSDDMKSRRLCPRRATLTVSPSPDASLPSVPASCLGATPDASRPSRGARSPRLHLGAEISHRGVRSSSAYSVTYRAEAISLGSDCRHPAKISPDQSSDKPAEKTSIWLQTSRGDA